MRVHQIKIDFQVTTQVKRYVYAYLIESEYCYLIDSGVYNSQSAIVDKLKEIGREVEDIKGIFLTHAHPDHIGTAAWFKSQCGAKIYASAGEKPWIEDVDLQFKERPIPNFYNLAGKSVEIDCVVKDGDALQLEDHLQIKVISTPGHSVDEVSYQINRAMFIGDSIPVKGDIPIYVNVADSINSIHVIDSADHIAAFYPAWDQTYTREEMSIKAADARELIHVIGQAAAKASETNNNIDTIAAAVCQILDKPMLMANPLFKRTIQAHLKKRN